MKLPKADVLRKNELAKIHLAKKQLALDDDEYRAILLSVTGRQSAADLDWQGRNKYSTVAAVAGNDAIESRPWQKIHELCKKCLADVHLVPLSSIPRENRRNPPLRSSRHHPKNREKPKIEI